MAPAEASLRLFVGVSVPPGLERTGVIEATRRRFPAARWTPPEAWHVTVLFLGDVAPAGAPAGVDEVADRLRLVAGAASGFSTAFTGLGGFPSTAQARVVWVGLNDDDRRWTRLASAVRRSLADRGRIAPEVFVPHVTVARSDRPLALSGSLLDPIVPSVGFPVTELTLFRSHLGAPRARYEPLARFPLRPAAPQ